MAVAVGITVLVAGRGVLVAEISVGFSFVVLERGVAVFLELEGLAQPAMRDSMTNESKNVLYIWTLLSDKIN